MRKIAMEKVPRDSDAQARNSRLVGGCDTSM
jgi:hypothetical protein